MKLRLLVSTEASCSEGDISAFVNRLQSLFTVEVVSARIELPTTDSLRPLMVSEILAHLSALGILTPTLALALPVLLTSRHLAGIDSNSVLIADQFVTISDHLQDLGPDATTRWFAKHLIRVGTAAIAKRECDSFNCVCGSNSDYFALCGECETSLRRQGYRDGLTHLKNSINWLNQFRVDDPAAETQIPPIRAARLPLAEGYVEEYEKRNLAPFNGKTVLMVLHFLSDVLPFVDAVAKLGASYQNMVLIAKPYPYSRRDQVTHELECRGVQVYRADKDRPISALAREVLERLSVGGSESKIVVIEDGGYFGPLLHEPEFASVLTRCIGIVEQTTKGIRAYEGIKDFKVAILSVAQSRFKNEFESPEIGRITIQNISRFVPNVKLSGRNAIVFGFGAIGEQVAACLNRSFNMGVSVVVIDNEHLLKAQHRKDVVVEAKRAFEELRFKDRAAIVVGTSGRPATISETVLRALPNGCILVSTSSDRIEIDIEALERLSGSEGFSVEEGKTEYVLNIDGARKVLTILAEGYPINFYGSESLPNDTIDPIMTLLLLCGIELCEKTLAPGVNKEHVDVLTKERFLVEKCIERFENLI